MASVTVQCDLDTNSCDTSDCNTSTNEEDGTTNELFADFLNEINAIQPSIRKRKKETTDTNVLSSFGSSEEEVERLTKRIHLSSFDVLQLNPDASLDDIKKQYRKISLIVHPDKCKLENAEAAFHVVTRAYEEVQLPENREKYKKVIKEAEKRVLKERKKENSIRAQKKEPLLPVDESSIKEDISNMCERLLKEIHERREYSDRVRKANEDRDKFQEEMEAEDEKDKMHYQKQWNETRDGRVGGWRGFQDKVKNKSFKLGAFLPHRLKKEERTKEQQLDKDDFDAKRKKIFSDESYKSEWR